MTAIDEDVHNIARGKGINVSKVLDDALRKELDIIDVKIENSNGVCDFCGIEDKKADRDNLFGLTWLYPDERWICDKCLKIQGKAKMTRTVRV